MKGSYRIRIRSKRVSYDFTLYRNITIIQGDSATGKSTLVRLIDNYYNEGSSSGVKLECQKTCRVLGGKDWEHNLEAIKDSIVFLDEGNKFIKSDDFAEAIKNSDNYYVIITREDLSSLPYSVNEIYGIKINGKTLENEPVYNEMYRIYGSYTASRPIEPVMVITEDSNSGFYFFEHVCKQSGIKCISAEGKSKVVKHIKAETTDRILLIADGAAFGPHMREVMQYLKIYTNYMIYLPESFEWLILKSGIFRSKVITDILDNPSDYIESSEYFSWERFFTALLVKETADNKKISVYTKTGKLSNYYTNPENTNKILNELKNIKLL
ncbi:MAG: translation initiation factor 2 [Lachnospiraceae bacterium]|nr:translation initiation factor 2 [Lachnospiraceae bacterium]